MNHDDILNNPAQLTEHAGTEVTNDCCGYDLVFALRDRHHAFSLSISTVLECLSLAEQQGAIPPLAPLWWSNVAERYHLDLAQIMGPNTANE
ncbi:hypothetical protein ACRYJU_04720 [Alloalcanivorax xenomutans]|uniref:Uncharacterized protein n=1 Tax=Alcanivorax xiamenensis TaxID=1177156 RepID=A0ABQ6Y564_9GAMM|nr:hypothetical protein [Alcanivorax xiamenensis]KAF0804370.1 hypothetical protein A6D6_03107 [Alcanivorax xiamenensis]